MRHCIGIRVFPLSPICPHPERPLVIRGKVTHRLLSHFQEKFP